VGYLYPPTFKKFCSELLAFERGCYRALTEGCRLGRVICRLGYLLPSLKSVASAEQALDPSEVRFGSFPRRCRLQELRFSPQSGHPMALDMSEKCYDQTSRLRRMSSSQPKEDAASNPASREPIGLRASHCCVGETPGTIGRSRIVIADIEGSGTAEQKCSPKLSFAGIGSIETVTDRRLVTDREYINLNCHQVRHISARARRSYCRSGVILPCRGAITANSQKQPNCSGASLSHDIASRAVNQMMRSSASGFPSDDMCSRNVPFNARKSRSCPMNSAMVWKSTTG
jgi:hypothetical protein